MPKFAVMKMFQNTQCFPGRDKEQLKHETLGLPPTRVVSGGSENDAKKSKT
jgi:hypothetical protein